MGGDDTLYIPTGGEESESRGLVIVLYLDRPALSSLTDFLCFFSPHLASLHTLLGYSHCLARGEWGKMVKLLGYISQEAKEKLLVLTLSACHHLYSDEMTSP